MQEFLATHPVFTYREFAASLGRGGARSGKALDALLAYHCKQGRLLRVRRGLYCTVPPGTDPAACPVDAWLLAAKMADDAVLAYHTALEFHGRAYSVFNEIQYLSQHAVRHTEYRSFRLRRVKFPCRLAAAGREFFGVVEEDRGGISVAVTSLERTLVDVLDRPDLGGGWEEIWRSLESVAYFELDKVVQYALLLENATTAAKVGFFLDQHRQPLMVEASHLDPLRRHRPREPHYMDKRGRGRLVSPWNLVAPTELLDRPWQEPA